MPTFAVIPAAGKSVRMGRPKLALPLNGRTVLERVIMALRQAGIEHIIVVVGPHVASLARLAESSGAHALVLPEETPDMRATLEKGLDWLEARFQPSAEDWWLLVPADHPTIQPSIVEKLLRARADTAAKSIILPTYQGKRGHPTLISWSHVAGIRAMPSGLGLNQYLRGQPADVLEVPTNSPQVVCDLDTPEDYEAFLKELRIGASE
jgi:molybdenum cofactor cytidylyltransferase